MSDYRSAKRPPADTVLQNIADYVLEPSTFSDNAYRTAQFCLLDSIGCALQALRFPACSNLLGPIVPGAELANGAKIPGTPYQLEPVQAAFNLGAMIRWLDYNDTWLAAEWGHPSDNFGGLFTLCDYLSRNGQDISIKQLLDSAIKAYEIQGVLALENSFNRVGLDHVILVRIATTATATGLLGGNRDQIINAVSNAWIDGGALRTYRHAPNTGSRKSWAAGDATSRGVRLALMAMKDEMGYPSALSATQWGFYDVLFDGKPFELNQTFSTYVMENILFKISFPAEFHAQTAVEAALTLHPHVSEKLDNIEKIVIETQEAGARIIDKTGPLNNPADRDHCIQYMVAIPLIFGRLIAEDYEDEIAFDPRVDNLRNKMQVVENKAFSKDYLDPSKRAIGNAIQIFFSDGSKTERIEVSYPIGHRCRRDEGIPLLMKKFQNNVDNHFKKEKRDNIKKVMEGDLQPMIVREFMDLFAE